ncbi:MAG TPA: carbohydrate ABC transporter substrate-binding protein, partial [Bacilli bacterium]
MKLKKVSIILLGIIMILSLLAGCGKTPAAEENKAAQTSAPTEAPTAEPKKEPVKLTMWGGVP